MSDYSADTGKLKTLSYVHVTTTNNGQDLFIQCTCQIYNTIKCAGLSQVDLQDGQDVVLDESLTCMHCRFYKEHLHQYREKLYNITSSTCIDNKIKDSLSTVNDPVVVLGIPTINGTTKLSIVSGEGTSMVHINFYQTNSCFANCQNGECKSKLMNKKKIPKLITIQEHDSVCNHIQTLFANFEVLENIFPEYFSSTIVNEDMEYVQYHEDVTSNTQDECIDPTNNQTTDHFNTTTGLWEFGGKSTHVPREMSDIQLSRCVYLFH